MRIARGALNLLAFVPLSVLVAVCRVSHQITYSKTGIVSAHKRVKGGGRK